MKSLLRFVTYPKRNNIDIFKIFIKLLKIFLKFAQDITDIYIIKIKDIYPTQLNKEHLGMEKTQADALVATMEISRVDLGNVDVSKPLQDLFDECLHFISVNDFNV